MKVIIGVDQGGTGTRAVACAGDGRLLGLGKSTGGAHVYVGMEMAMRAVREACLEALEKAGVLPEQVSYIFGGFTGADWPDEYGLLRDAVRSLGLCDQVSVTNDTIIALRGGTEQSYGAILISGSGANCAVRAPDGREFIYHYYHDDELQGGSAIGRAALKAVFRSHTGRRPPTRLTGRILSFYQLNSVDDLMRGLVEGRMPSSSVTGLAPLVFDEACHGDEAATAILSAYGEGCAELVVNGLRRFDMLDVPLEVVLSGNVFKGVGPILIDSLTAGIHRSAPKARLVNARYEPVVGAALLGLEQCEIAISDGVKHKMEITAGQLNLIRLKPEGGDPGIN